MNDNSDSVCVCIFFHSYIYVYLVLFYLDKDKVSFFFSKFGTEKNNTLRMVTLGYYKLEKQILSLLF